MSGSIANSRQRTLIKGASILSMDADTGVLQRGDVLMENGRIVS